MAIGWSGHLQGPNWKEKKEKKNRWLEGAGLGGSATPYGLPATFFLLF
jgi:hypothetical protein